MIYCRLKVDRRPVKRTVGKLSGRITPLPVKIDLAALGKIEIDHI